MRSARRVRAEPPCVSIGVAAGEPRPRGRGYGVFPAHELLFVHGTMRNPQLVEVLCLYPLPVLDVRELDQRVATLAQGLYHPLQPCAQEDGLLTVGMEVLQDDGVSTNANRLVRAASAARGLTP